LYEQSHWHPPFTTLGIAAVGASQARHIPVLLLPPDHDPLQITGVKNHPKNTGVQKMGSHPCDFEANLFSNTQRFIGTANFGFQFLVSGQKK